MKNKKAMKAKLFFILCLCSLSMNAWASPGITTRDYWGEWSLYREYSLVDGGRAHRTDHYFFRWRDTIIGVNAYEEVFWREDGDYENEAPAGYALREEGDRVYVYDYDSQKEYILFDFSLKENDILVTDWMEETDTRKNPVFRVLAVGDTTMAIKAYYGGWHTRQFHYLKVYDIVHQITDMWLTGVGSVSHGIAWRRDFGRSLDTLETVLCVNAGRDYKNPKCSTCYIPQVEPEYVYYRGKLIFKRVYNWCEPAVDCYSNALAIQWGELTPLLCSNIEWGFDCCGRIGCPPFLFNGVEYHVGDSVELEGYVSQRRSQHGGLYYEFELERDVFPEVPVEKRQKAELKLFPNPAKETITLRATGCTLQKVEILDVNGRVLHAATLNGTETFDYNVSQMPSGIYLARVKTSCGVLTEKFSVK